MTNKYLIHKSSKSVLFPSGTVLPAECKSREVTYFGKRVIQVRHREDEVRALWEAGFTDIPAPIEVYHTFKPLVTSSGKVFQTLPHQIKTAAFFTIYKKCFCSSGLGTGKSHSSLSAMEYMLSNGIIDKVLIIAPLTVTRSVWVSGIFDSFTEYPVSLLLGSAARRKESLWDETPIKILNHDGVSVLKDELPKWINSKTLIIYDEASALKSGSGGLSARTKLFTKLVSGDCRMALLSATPCPNSEAEAYSLCRLINPQSPRFYGQFRDMVAYKYGTFKWVRRQNAHEIVAKYLQPCISFSMDQVVGLPEMTFDNIEVELSDEQKKHLKTLKHDAMIMLQDQQHLAANAAVVAIKMLQIVLGVIKVEDEYVKIDGFDNRMNVIMDIIEQAGKDKVILIVPFKGALRYMYEVVSKKYNAVFVNGDVTGEERNNRINEFKEGDAQVLLAHHRVLSHGISLECCHIMVLAGPIASGDSYVQLLGRMARLNQKHTMVTYQLYGDRIEQKMYDTLEERQDNQNKVLALMKEFVEDT